MKFGLTLPRPNVAEFHCGEGIHQLAVAIERAGVSFVGTSEHPAPDAHWLHNDPGGHDCVDPLVTLSFVAAATTRLKIWSCVIVLPYRNPFITAKAAATLQVLSDNRFILGVGSGYQKAEFDALGVPFNQRGALTDEALETIRLAWKGGAVVKKGRHFDAVGNEPRPVPSPPPPIWVGGASDKAVDRAARWGDGWIPHFRPPTNHAVTLNSSIASMDHYVAQVTRLKNLRAKLGRSGPFDIAPRAPFLPSKMDRSMADQFLDATRELQAHGANCIWTPLPHPDRVTFLEYVAWYGEEVIGRFKSH